MLVRNLLSFTLIKLSLALIFVLAIFLPTPICAQEDAGLRLTTSPLPISLVTDPGKSITTDLRVQNSGNRPDKFKVGLLKFEAQGDSGKPKLMERGVGDDYFDWVSFSPSTFEAIPNEWKTIKMTINVPKTAAFGYYYAVTFTREVDTVNAPKQTNLVGSAATLVLLEARNPGAKREMSITSFSVNNPWYEFLPVHFDTVIKNSGNIHGSVSGSIFISRDGDPSSLERVDVNGAKGNILPQSTRAFGVDWDHGFPVNVLKEENGKTVLDKGGHSITQLHWDFSQAQNFRFGHYSARMILAYDNGKRDVPIEATTSFWVVPWRLLLVIALNIVVVLGFFGLLGFLLFKHYRRRV